jgi:hypothetical protein
VFQKLRVITRNYEPKLLRVSRNYDVEVHENHEITHFRIITTKTRFLMKISWIFFMNFTNMDYQNICKVIMTTSQHCHNMTILSCYHVVMVASSI